MNARRPLATAIVAGALAFSYAHSSEVAEDFTGSRDPFTDCEPMCWNVLPCCPGDFTTTEDGLAIMNTGASDAVMIGSEDCTGDVTMRVCGSMNGTTPRPGGNLCSGITAGFGVGETGNAYYAVVCASGQLKLIKFRNLNQEENLHGDAGVDFLEGNLEFELRVAGPLVELRAWREGDERPEAAQVTMADSEYRDYSLLLGGNVPQGAPPVLVRSVTITAAPDPTDTTFLRGDCNDDGMVNVTDVVFVLSFLFLGEDAPGCDDACDSNDDSQVNISDAITTLGVLFLGQGSIPLPGMMECGVDPTGEQPNELGCEEYKSCPEG